MGSAFTFLVVDDDPDTRYLNRHELEKTFRDSAVIEAATCEEALRRTENARLDAVLTDHHLGRDDGAMFIARLRERGVRCPIIMVTASCDPKVHQRAIAAGAARVFTPVSMDFVGYLRGVLKPG